MQPLGGGLGGPNTAFTQLLSDEVVSLVNSHLHETTSRCSVNEFIIQVQYTRQVGLPVRVWYKTVGQFTLSLMTAGNCDRLVSTDKNDHASTCSHDWSTALLVM